MNTTEHMSLTDQLRASTNEIARLTKRYWFYFNNAESPDDVYDAELALENLNAERKHYEELLQRVA
jgi:uncharacterized protein YecE (DUF72 family)